MADFGELKGMIEFVNLICFLNKLGDEFHYLFECSYFEGQRRMYFPRDLLRNPKLVQP